MDTVNRNIVLLLERAAAVYPDRTALIEGVRSLTYAQLLAAVRAASQRLGQEGIGAGDAVLVVAPVSTRLYILLSALFHRGAVAVFVDAWASRERLEAVERAMPLKAFVGVWRARMARFALPGLRRIPHAFSLDKLTDPDPHPRAGECPPAAEVDDNAPALVTFTTGSTGIPKGANRTHGFLRAQHVALVRHLGGEPGEADLATLPIFPLSNLALGATTLLPRIDPRQPLAFSEERIVREMNIHGVVSSVGSPAFFERLARYCVVEERRPESLRRLHVGGAAVMPRVVRLLAEAFPRTEVKIVYGATEAEPIAMIAGEEMLHTLERDRERGVLLPGLPAGVPVNSLRVELLDEGGEWVVDPDQPGEVCVCGEHVLGSYIGPAEGWSEKYVEREGKRWLRTGDAALRAPDGGLRLLGRWKHRIVRNGRTFFTLPVELLLSTVDGLVAGTIVEHKGEMLGVVEGERGTELADATVLELLHAYGVPVERVQRMARIPRDPRHASRIDMEALVERL